MKEIIQIFLICLIITNSYSQNSTIGKITYKKYMADITKKIKEDESKKTYLEFRTRINNNLKKVDYTLDFNSEESIFYGSKILGTENDRNLKLAVNFGGGRVILYINNKTKQKLHQADAYGEKFLIEGMVNYNWIITQETKKIDKFLCFKAVLKEDENENKQDVIAWFTSEIPFSHGPNGYCSLPGLILELELNNGFLFKAVSIVLKKDNFFKILKPEKGLRISEKEFIDLGKRTMDKKN